jgi:hypothetical protein
MLARNGAARSADGWTRRLTALLQSGFCKEVAPRFHELCPWISLFFKSTGAPIAAFLLIQEELKGIEKSAAGKQQQVLAPITRLCAAIILSSNAVTRLTKGAACKKEV